MREKYPELLLIDAGDAVKSTNPYDLISYKYFLEGLLKIGYKIFNFGTKDLLVPVENFKEILNSFPEIPFISANVTYKDGSSIAPPYRIIEVNGLKIGILGVTESCKVIGSTNNAGDPANNACCTPSSINTEYNVYNEEESIKKHLPKLLLESDIQILLASVCEKNGRKLAQKFKQFEIVFFGGETEELIVWKGNSLYGPFALGKNMTAPYLLREGDTGRFQLQSELKLEKGKLVEFTTQDFELTDKYTDDSLFEALITRSYKEMEDYSRKMLTKDIPPPGSDEFVPPDDCASTDCHLDEYEVWENSDHEKAYVTLTNAVRKEISSPNTNPRCVGCHTLGFGDWDGGFVSTYQIPISHQSVSCGNCHGKAGKHARATLEEIDKLKIKTEVSKPSYKTCLKCHDKEHDTDFDYKRDLEKISQHNGKIHFEFQKVWDAFTKSIEYKIYLATQK